MKLYLESRLCPIFKATGLLVLGVKLPKKIGHLAFQVVVFWVEKKISNF